MAQRNRGLPPLDGTRQTRLGGPFGDLSDDRRTILYKASKDNKLKPEDLDQFKDETGRNLTEVYTVINKTTGGDF